VQTRNELVAIDPLTDSVVIRVPVPGIKHPHGFLVDPDGQLIYVTGEENGRIAVLDLRSTQIVHISPVGGHPDVLAMDTARRHLFVAAESGVISAFDVRGDSLVALPSYHGPRAHSVAVDPTTRKYTLLPERGCVV
jgi:DNA-binding beta-propeller fold protein YncE